MRVESTPGSGATFSAYLPAQAESPIQENAPQAGDVANALRLEE